MKRQRVLSVFPQTPKLQKEALKFFKLAKSAKTVLISSTLTSDGDSIGAQLGLEALVRTLRKGKKTQITIVNESEVPDRYKFLSGADQILSWEEWTSKKRDPNFDLGIVTDGGVERTGDVAELFKFVHKRVLVDHHAVGSSLAYDANILDLNSSSSCELVYNLFELAKLPVNAKLAEALYVGIVFDTGFFKHSLTTSRTHYVAAQLLQTGIDFSKISDRAILDRTWEAQLLLKALLNNLERSAGGQIISSYWSADDLRAIKPRDGDQEGMINQLYYTEKSEVVVLFVQKSANDDVKLSFRSKGKINVAEFARSLNSHGGGHVRAAGCSMKGSLVEVKDRVVAALIEKLQELGNEGQSPKKASGSH